MQTLRQQSIAWWNKIAHGERKLYMEGYFQGRDPKSLTGREIEKIYVAESESLLNNIQELPNDKSDTQ